MLYVRSNHQMYNGHQANWTYEIRIDDMTIMDADVMASGHTMVGHSFNQYILVDRENRVISLDHGDGSPRSLVMMRWASPAGSQRIGFLEWRYDIQQIPGGFGDNVTGTSLGGMAETVNGYMVAYNYDGMGSYGQREVYYQYVSKASGSGTSVQLTNDGKGTTTPVIAPIGLNGGYILWNQRESTQIWGMEMPISDTLYYVRYSDGGGVGAVKTAKADLSDCTPIYYKGKPTWYVTKNSAPVFYTLEENGDIERAATGPESVSEEPEDPTDEEWNEEGEQTEEEETEEEASGDDSSRLFTDVTERDWFYDSVLYVYKNGLMSGTGEGKFSPRTATSRAMLATVLYRLAGSTAARGKNSFTDVKAGSWYDDAVTWAAENGIVYGTGDGKFSPNGSITREQLVTMLYRYAQKVGSPTIIGGIDQFTDWQVVSDFAIEPMCWAVSNSIISGKGNGMLDPKGSASRAEIASVLQRFVTGLA